MKRPASRTGYPSAAKSSIFKIIGDWNDEPASNLYISLYSIDIIDDNISK
jgi:hypothetical protein